MKLQRLLFVLTSTFISSVILQEPPPVFDLPPPPPFEPPADTLPDQVSADTTAGVDTPTGAAADSVSTDITAVVDKAVVTGVDPVSTDTNPGIDTATGTEVDPVSSNTNLVVDTTAVTDADPVSSNTTVVDTAAVTDADYVSINTTDVAANINKTKAITNESVDTKTDILDGVNDTTLTTADALTRETLDMPGINVSADVDVNKESESSLLGSIFDSVSNLTTVDSVGNDTPIVSNLTDIEAMDTIISAILNASMENELKSASVPNDAIINRTIQDDTTLMEIPVEISNIIPEVSANITSGENATTTDSNATRTADVVTDAFMQQDAVDLPPPPISFVPGLEANITVSDTGANVSDVSTFDIPPPVIPIDQGLEAELAMSETGANASDISTFDIPPPVIPIDYGLEAELAMSETGENVSEISTFDTPLPVISFAHGLGAVIAVRDRGANESAVSTFGIPPPVIPIDHGLEAEFAMIDSGANVSDESTLQKTNMSSTIDTNATEDGNKTYIDQVDIFITDTGVKIQHTPPENIPSDSVDPRATVDLAPTPVDVPPPPSDGLSVDFIEKPGSTTVEISDIFSALAGLGSSGKSSPPMQTFVPEVTTQEMIPIMSVAPVIVPLIETTTVQPTVGVTQEITVKYVAPRSNDTIYRHTSEKGRAASPDHPPPIFSGGSRPSVYTDPYGPHDGYFPVPETTTSRPVITTEGPPPPINVPASSDSRQSWLRQRYQTTASHFVKWTPSSQLKHSLTNLDPRHMNVAELAAYALEMTNTNKASNQPAQGIQVFFPTEPETTTKKMTTTAQNTTPRPKTTKRTSFEYQQERRSNAFIEYLRQRYGIHNVVPTTKRPFPVTTTAKRVKHYSRRFSDSQYILSHMPQTTTQTPRVNKFFDSNYLLSHLDIAHSKLTSPRVHTTTLRPTKRQFFSTNYLLSQIGDQQGPVVRTQLTLPPKQPRTKSTISLPHGTEIPSPSSADALKSWLNKINIKSSAVTKIGMEQINGQSVLKEQRQGHVETRPIDLNSNQNIQSFTNINVNPERNVRMNINLKPGINQWRGQPNSKAFALQPDKRKNSLMDVISPGSFTDITFKPVVYGNKKVQATHTTAVDSLKARFNKKWYHPEDVPSVIGPAYTHIIQPKRNIQIQIEVPVQHSSFEQQQQLLKQQEIKLRQQQQKLKEQQAILLQQQQLRQQKEQQEILLRQQQKEQQELILRQQKKEQQEMFLRQKQREQHELLLRQQQRERLHQQQQQQQQQERLLRQHKLQQEQQRQTEQDELLRRQQKERLRDVQRNHFPLASRTGHSDILLNDRAAYHNTEISSIQIFRAPAMMRRLTRPERKHTEIKPFTHWRAPSDLQHLHGHLAVPYNVKYVSVAKTTPTPPTPLTYTFTTPATKLYIPTVATTRVTSPPPQPAAHVTADPNPPPIFDTKIRHTFMPMPKIEPTTQAPKLAEHAVGGFDKKQARRTQIDERCQGCVFVNARCLLPDPIHCNYFIECVQQGTFVRAFSRECALGSFFDRKSFLCVDPRNADCPTDRCRVPGTKWYAIHGHCKHYWSCGSREGGGIFAQSECCPDMGGFSDPEGCVQNRNCTDTCSSVINKDGPTGCQLRNTSSPTVYFDGNANIERPCAPGTLFNERACTCVQDVSIERSETKPAGFTNCTCTNESACSCSDASQAAVTATSCLPMLAMTFDRGLLEDSSYTKQHVGIEGIAATKEGEAIYNGGGKLVLWRYANLMFPIVFAIKFRFYSSTAGPRHQTIFSNCDPKGGQEPSIDISLDTTYHEVVFKINTYEGTSKRFTIIYQQNKWTTVDVIYDGERIVGSVDRRARNIFAGGGIETRPYPIGIGHCNGTDGFKGLLDDIFVYEDCIPDDMYGVFMSVLE